MSKETAIYEKGADCLRAFNSYIESITPGSWAQEQLDRFNLWAAHGGVFGDYKSRTSMDWRLRDRPELAHMMLELLSLLQECLSREVNSSLSRDMGDTITISQRNEDIANDSNLDQPAGSSAESIGSSSACSIAFGESENNATFDRIVNFQRNAEDIITRLFRLSAVIRSAGMSYRYEKAHSFIEWEDGVNLTAKFRNGIKLLLKHKRPQPQEYMISRLLESICLRQKQLAYSQRHKRIVDDKKLEDPVLQTRGPSLPPRSESASTTTWLRKTSALPTSSGTAELSRAVPSGSGQDKSFAAYSATYVPEKSVDFTRSITPRSARQGINSIDDCLDIRPPTLNPQGNPMEFECPFCAVPLVAEAYQGPAWRTHVLQDIRPYVCVLPDCKTPHALYTDGNSWMSHMQSAHTTTAWKCAAASHSQTPLFETESQFVAHISSEHAELFNREEAAELANLSRFERPWNLSESLWPECPICTESFDGKDFLSVFCHIAKDLLQYAVLCFSEPPDLVAQSQQSSYCTSISNNTLGHHRESELDMEQILPWDSGQGRDSAATEEELVSCKNDCVDIPPVDADCLESLGQVWKAIRSKKHEQLKEEPLCLVARPTRPNSRHDFDIAIICALTIEADAVEGLFDQYWDDSYSFGKVPGDPNTYTTGSIGHHNVVLAYMPGMGKANAASVASYLRTSYPNINLALAVGICGGVPFVSNKNTDKNTEIILGDIIISNGIVQYDWNRRLPDRFIRKNTLPDSLVKTNTEVHALLGKLEGTRDRMILNKRSISYLMDLQKKSNVQAQYPGASYDKLFEAGYYHRNDGETCEDCKCEGQLIPRIRLEQQKVKPAVHFGLIASGDTIIKHGIERDAIAKQEDIIGFEMESAGLWDTFPSIIIRGVCDYADSHKTENWQRYAAATAAACAKAFLELREPPVTGQVSNHLAPTIRAIPYPRNEDIIHRANLIDRVNILLPTTATEYNSAALWGLGGSGKTQIALDYAYRRCQDSSCSVFWVHADSKANFAYDYQTIAKLLGVDNSYKDEGLFEAVRYHIEALAKWVLILDDADDLSLFGVASAENNTQTSNLMAFIPQGATGTVLWTSRDEHIIGTLVGSQRGIMVGPMTPNESAKLLNITQNMDIRRDSSKAIALINELQQLPLAISQAGAYIRRTSITIEKYLAMLSEAKWRWAILKEIGTDPYRRLDVSNSVLNTWRISIKRIQQENPTAYRILNIIAYLNHRNIPFELLKAAIQQDIENQGEELINLDLLRAITPLKELYFLVIMDTGNKKQSYEMHKLVQEAIRFTLSMNITNEQGIEENVQDGYNQIKGEVYYSRIAIQTMVNVFPISSGETWQQCEEYLAHAMAVGEWAEVSGMKIDIAGLFSSVSTFLYDRGRWKEKELVDMKVLYIRQEILGQKHPDTIRSMAALTTTYHAQGQYNKAESMRVKVLNLQREIFGEKHPETIDSMVSLAAIYHTQGRYNENEDILIEVLDLRREILGEKHPDTLQVMHNLALTWHICGRRDDALSLMDQCLQLQQSILGSDHPSTIQSEKVFADWQEKEH